VDAAGRVGFYRRGSRAVVEIAGCPLLEERLEAAIGSLKGRRGPADVELRAGDDGEVSEAEGLPFGQVNGAVNGLLRERLAARVASAFPDGARIAVVDLYCGDGNLSLPLARLARSIRGFDSSPAAAGAAAARARALGAVAEYRAAAVDEGLLRSLGRDRPDLLIADPPRSGLARLARAAADLRAPLVALVSCAPPMLARDLRAFLERGYAIDLVQPFDMFPQTFHVETLAVLRLQPIAPSRPRRDCAR
jgi:23S rRNA (uracil1939-C5)-methyltransferase